MVCPVDRVGEVCSLLLCDVCSELWVMVCPVDRVGDVLYVMCVVSYGLWCVL